MSRPRLAIHIGHPKTGTSAIQSFLLENRDALKAQGIWVPLAGVVSGGHHGLTRHWYALRGREDGSARELDRLAAELRTCGCPGAVVSSEGLIQENPADLARRFAGDFDVTVIYYIRRQDLAAESVYAQRVRSFVQMAAETPQAMLPLLVPHYGKIIARWAGAFGRDRLAIRPFEAASFRGGSLLSDFLGLLGADPARFPGADKRRNTAFKRPYLEFKRACNLLPLLEDEHQVLGADLDRLSAADASPHPKFLLSRAERIRLLESCADENAALARDYLGRPDGLLFHDPPPADDPGFRPLGPPPAPLQHAILEALSPRLREVLEYLDVGIRLRLPGEDFMPAIPDDPDDLRRRLRRRDQERLRRRMDRVENRFREGLPAASSPPGWVPGLRRGLAGWLRRLSGK